MIRRARIHLDNVALHILLRAQRGDSLPTIQRPFFDNWRDSLKWQRLKRTRNSPR
jgi:hypothetical protein